MDITAEQVIKEQGILEGIRKPYENLKQVCVQFTYPGRSDQWDLFGLDEGRANTSSGGRKIFDPTGAKGLDIWSNGILGYWMPKGVKWFAEQMEQRNLKTLKPVIQWLQDTDDHLRDVLGRSNYYDQRLVEIKDAGGIGDGFMYIEEDNGKQMMLCPHPREFWIKRDFWGRVCGIHHKFTKTLWETKKEFGDKALSNDQKIALETSPDQKIEIIYAIYRNEDYNPYSIGVMNMPWRYVYINVAKKIRMVDSGRTTLNPIPWSLNRPTHEVYGRGIVSQMLIEIITANFLGKDMLIASQQAARPSMLVTKALKSNLSLKAGAVNYVGSQEMMGLKMGDLVSRIVDTSGYPFGIDNHQRWQQMIEDRFGVPLFLALNSAISQSYKNIEHVRGVQAERAVLMAPFLGSLGTTTDMELDRVYAIELEAGRAPEPPAEVLMAQNGRINIEYIGPLSQLLKQYYETNNLLVTIQNMQAAMTVAPESSVVVNGDELMRKILRSGNTPEDLILTQEEVNEIKAIAAAQQEAAMTAELAAKTASAVPGLSKAIEKDSVLDKLSQEAA